MAIGESDSNWQLADSQLAMFDQKKEANSQKLTANCLKDLWNKSFIIDTYESRVEADFHRQRGEEIMKKYFDWWKSEHRQVMGVETSFKIDVGGVYLGGRIDRIEKGIKVIDFKTTQPRLQEEVDADLQLSIYSLAIKELYGEFPSELVMLYLNENSVTEIKTERSESQLKDAIKQITSVNNYIKEGEFKPRPSASVCKRCPYKGVCDVAAV
jgi:RecB family exonuclease|tara:strand:+ start:204 stop:839 length:636 start_codon:yes stop_codon:yes gene_type:complete